MTVFAKIWSWKMAQAREALRMARSPELRTVLWFCVPALLVGLVLRALLMARMPSAFFHDDTRFVMDPALDFLKGKFELNGRRPFLVPLLYSVPLALRLPFLSTVAFFQHLLGLGLIVQSGFLCRLWFPKWRWWIMPLTLLMAVNPVILWYEHMALPEFLFIFSSFAVVLAGTYYLRKPDAWVLLAFMIILVLNAGTRPEANLLFLFGLMIVTRAHWSDWRRMAVVLGVALLVTAVGMKLTRTGQGGKLLLTTLLPLIPDDLRTAPQFSEAVAELREETRKEWTVVPRGVNGYRKRLEKTIQDFLVEKRGLSRDEAKDEVDSFGRQVALETLLRSGFGTLHVTMNKFRMSLDDPKLRQKHTAIPAGTFGPDYVFREQGEYIYDTTDRQWTSSNRYSEIYFGRQPQEPGEVQPLLYEQYAPFHPDWLTTFQVWVYDWFFLWHTPRNTTVWPELPGLPLVYPLALVGLLALSMTHRPRLLNAPQLWVVMLLLLWFAIFLTGNKVGRYRMVFEPFWWIGLLGLLEAGRAMVAALCARGRVPRKDPFVIDEKFDQRDHGHHDQDD